MNKRVIAVFAAVLALLGAAYLGSPYWAAHELRNPALSGDVDDLSDAVDFPAVRESLKSQLTAAMMSKLQNDRELNENPFAGLGTMMMPAIINHMVDMSVTANGLSAMLKQGRIHADQTAPSPAKSDVRYGYVYRGLNRFAITVHAPELKPEDAPNFVLERRGLFTWKMIRIEISPKLFAGTPV